MPKHTWNGRSRRVAGVALLLAAGLSTARAQALRGLVDAALDQQVTKKIEISERPFREGLAELEKATGLRFRLDPQALDWMPYGEQTRIELVIDNLSVRAALTRIFDGLGLALRVAGDDVLIEPAPVLDRLGRRLTIDEVRLLQELAANSWSAIAGSVKFEYRLPPEGEPHRALEAALRDAPPGPASAQLEGATQALGLVWVPSGRTVAIYSQQEAVAQRLDRPLDLNYRQVALDEFLVDLGRRIGLTVRFQPGALQKVNASNRQVDFVQRGTSVRQVLELIVGRTGLTFEIVPDGIVVAAAGADAGSAAPGGRVVAILRVPVGSDGTTIDYLLREDELPAEFRKLRDRKMPEVIELLRKELR